MDPISHVKSVISGLLDDHPAAISVVCGDFNTDVTVKDDYGLAEFIQEEGLRHSSSEAELLLPTCTCPTLRTATKIHYQLVTSTAGQARCAPLSDFTATSAHYPLLGHYSLLTSPPRWWLAPS